MTERKARLNLGKTKEVREPKTIKVDNPWKEAREAVEQAIREENHRAEGRVFGSGVRFTR